jgi:hypothetical protein
MDDESRNHTAHDDSRFHALAHLTPIYHPNATSPTSYDVPVQPNFNFGTYRQRATSLIYAVPIRALVMLARVWRVPAIVTVLVSSSSSPSVVIVVAVSSSPLIPGVTISQPSLDSGPALRLGRPVPLLGPRCPPQPSELQYVLLVNESVMATATERRSEPQAYGPAFFA